MTASTDMAVAVYGFLPRLKRYESAGISYEFNIIKDKLALKRCTLPVFKSGTNGSSSSSGSSSPTPDETGDRSHLFDADDAKYLKYLMKLDPNDTKNQDHYKVLGLSKLRFRATAEEIRTCYRRKVLKYHPDKQNTAHLARDAAQGYFTCLTKAYEQLGVSEAKRQAYDSVDHKFNDQIPNEKQITKENFINELAPVFELNSRWSTIQPVPQLGDMNSSREEVERFYSFWFNFNTWREFSYLDEEDKEKGEDRYERRELEKINKAERERRRKEEVKRIRRLVDLSYSKDPRIAKFKREEQEAKEKAKEERQRIQREKQEAIARQQREQEEEEKRKKEEEERKIKEEKEREKKERDAMKKAVAAQRRRLKKLAESAGHWTENAGKKLQEMERIERLCLTLNESELSELCDSLEKLSVTDEILARLDEIERVKKESRRAAEALEKPKEPEKKVEVTWTNEEIQLLVKASNMFPAGTIDRWIVIADYINEHRKDKTSPPKNEKQVIKQNKAVQAMSVKLPSTTQNQLGATLPDEDTWTPAEQKLLEEALRKFPSSDPERWDKISIHVATKTKKACIRRFKYLAQMVKNKK